MDAAHVATLTGHPEDALAHLAEAFARAPAPEIAMERVRIVPELASLALEARALAVTP